MAKSLRSKWKRKMRAIKRVRYGKKEMEKLKLLVQEATDVEMDNSNRLINVVDKSQMTRDTEQMEIDGHSKAIDVKQNRFPVWISSHRKKKIIKINKKANKQNKKLVRKERLKFKR